MTSWVGFEDVGEALALAPQVSGIGIDGHYRLPFTRVALMVQGSLALLPLGATSPPDLRVYGWTAFGGLRLLIPPAGHRRPEGEIDLLVGPSMHGTVLVGYFMVNGSSHDAFLSFRLNGRMLFRSPGARLRIGPVLRLETQPVFVVRRLHRVDGTIENTLRLRWNAHWALGGVVARVNLFHGLSIEAASEWGLAVWGDHRAGTPAVNLRFGIVLGEGQTR